MCKKNEKKYQQFARITMRTNDVCRGEARILPSASGLPSNSVDQCPWRLPLARKG